MRELQERWKELLMAGRFGKVRGRDLLSTSPFSLFSTECLAAVEMRLGQQ